MKVICECGKSFIAGRGDHLRCHVCGKTIDLTPLLAAREEASQQATIAAATELKFAGLRFDGQYCSTSPLELAASLAELLDLQVRFRQDLTVEVHCRHWATEGEEIIQENIDQQVITYDIHRDNKLSFHLNADIWIYDWEGHVLDDRLQLTYRMEEWFGIAGHAQCVVEGEAILEFQSDRPGEPPCM